SSPTKANDDLPVDHDGIANGTPSQTHSHNNDYPTYSNIPWDTVIDTSSWEVNGSSSVPHNPYHIPPQQPTHPGESFQQTHPYDNLDFSAGWHQVGSLPSLPRHPQGTSRVGPVSLAHASSHQLEFLPHPTQQRQSESVRRQGLSPQGSRGTKRKQDAEGSVHDSSAMQKKAKYQAKDFQQSLAEYEVDLADPATRSSVQAEQQEWWEELKKTDPRVFRRYQDTLRRLKKVAWSALTETQIEIMVLGYTREDLMTRPTDSTMAQWGKQQKRVSRKFQNLARDQNTWWNTNDSSKLDSVKNKLRDAIAVIMLSQFSSRDILNMGSMRFLDLKEAAIITCRKLKRHDEFLSYIHGLQENQRLNAQDVATVIGRLRTDSYHFRHDNENVDANGDGKK
ncbi:hypothetical protein H0H93_001875, partial [Arthromyces matolae]